MIHCPMEGGGISIGGGGTVLFRHLVVTAQQHRATKMPCLWLALSHRKGETNSPTAPPTGKGETSGEGGDRVPPDPPRIRSPAKHARCVRRRTAAHVVLHLAITHQEKQRLRLAVATLREFGERVSKYLSQCSHGTVRMRVRMARGLLLDKHG